MRRQRWRVVSSFVVVIVVVVRLLVLNEVLRVSHGYLPIPEIVWRRRSRSSSNIRTISGTTKLLSQQQPQQPQTTTTTTTEEEGVCSNYDDDYVSLDPDQCNVGDNTMEYSSDSFGQEQQEQQQPPEEEEHGRLQIEVSVLVQALLIVGCGYAAANVKRYMIARMANRSMNHLGRLTFYDNFLNVILSAMVARMLLHVYEIDLGPGFQSIFAAGGVGALVFGIASKGLAEQVVGGLVIKAWDVFSEGDEIILHECNGLEGIVKRIGLVETEIEGYDNIITKLPNSRIFNQRISNISHVKKSQVKQTVRIRYSDLPKITVVLEEIKQQITTHCCSTTTHFSSSTKECSSSSSSSSLLILDGSRPFRAHLYDYKEDHVQVLVNVHFRVGPGTEAYYECRQKVLEAIAFAMGKHAIEFAIPAVTYTSSSSSSSSNNEDDPVGGSSLFATTTTTTTTT